MLGLAARHGALAANPVREVGSVHSDHKPVRALSLDEVRRLRRAAADHDQGNPGQPRIRRLAEFVDMHSGTRARIGEILALRWGDVDLDAHPVSVVIRGTLIRLGGSLDVQDRPKSSGSNRVLVVPEFTRRMLIKRKDRLEPGSADQLIFTSTTGTPQDPDNLRRLWRRVRAEADLEWVTPHTIRKTDATLLDTNVSTKAAASQLGHPSTTMTERHYIQRAAQAPDTTAILEVCGTEEPKA